MVEKGSITIDGISLTVAAVSAHDFSVSMIPHTAEVTTLGSKKEGDIVNLETDIIGKYVEKLLHPQEEKKESHITREFLDGYKKRKNNRRNEQWKDLQPLRKHLRNYETEN